MTRIQKHFKCKYHLKIKSIPKNKQILKIKNICLFESRKVIFIMLNRENGTMHMFGTVVFCGMINWGQSALGTEEREGLGGCHAV